MKKKKSIIRAEAIIIFVLVLSLLLPQLIGTTTKTSNGSEEEVISSLDDFDGLTFAVTPGYVFEDYVKEYFPSSNLCYVSDWSQIVLSVTQGKADALIAESSSLQEILDVYDELTVYPVPVCQAEECFAATKTEKGAEIVALFNQYLSQITSDGTLDAIFNKWADADHAPDHLEIPELTGERGTIRIGASLDWSPYCYATGESPCGSFIDLTYQFCAWAGYIPEFEYVEFTSILAGVSTGTYDFIACGITPSSERSEQMYFTNSLFGEDIYVVARTDSLSFVTTNNTIADYKDVDLTFALMTGLDIDSTIINRFPYAKIIYFDTLTEIYTAVSTGKADMGITYSDNFTALMESFDNIAMLYEPLCVVNYAFPVQKNSTGKLLQIEYNNFIRKIKSDGTYDAILSKWNSGDESIMHMNQYSYTGEKGILRIGTIGTWYPKTYYIGDELSGELVELACAFCAQCGYIPDFQVMPFASELSGILSGNLDMIADGVPITSERLEQLYFTDTFLNSEIKLIVRSDNNSGEEVSKLSAFIDSMKSSFEKNFVREGRWKMLLSGLGITVALSVLALLCGTILGCGICALRMSKISYFTGFARIFIKVFQGTPIVVSLLVLYYVVFGKVDVSAFLVSVLGFSLDFAAYSSEIIRTGIESVPESQRLAARALGFSKSKTFIKIILPQALVHIIPVLSGQFIAMVKMTSVAGYISVQDLTKASDIIRSRTFEAFFPLISTAVIYFLIATLLVSILKIMQRRLGPSQHPRMLKGVKPHAD